LVTSQHELLHKTFCGSVKVLTEILELSHPDLFSRSHAVQNILEQLMAKLGLEERWEYKLATRLASIGCVVAPSVPDNGDTNKAAEIGVISPKQAETGKTLIIHIPRLKTVAEIVGHHASADGQLPDPASSEEALIKAGATLLRAAIELDSVLRQGVSQKDALREVSARMRSIPDNVLEAMHEIDVSVSRTAAGLEAVEVTPLELREGMVLAEHAQKLDGSTLLASGTRLTHVFIERLRSLSETVDVNPIYVFK
jgi:hypothetical protein